MRRATQQALSIPAFRSPMDCTPWVLGGLWPPELNQLTAETASLASYLSSDLQRIANSANEKLREISAAGLIEPIRQAEEARVVNLARAFAVLRVESTIRHLRKEPLGFAPQYLSLGATPDEPTAVVASEPAAAVVESPAQTQERRQRRTVAEDPASAEPTPPPAEPTPPPAEATPPAEPTTVEAKPPSVESAEQRLRRLVEFVARQEPGLAWAAGDRADGTTVMVTDLAHGWIPSGIDLPVGVELLPPQRRRGNLASLMGATERAVSYRPGDAFEHATELDVTAASAQARELAEVADLGWQLIDATQWRDGLPRMVHTMAKAGASGTGVQEAELDVLRVHVDTARYQAFAQYPDVNERLLANCLLLAATEAIASGDQIAANYHFAWFTELDSSAAAGWGQKT